MFSHLRHIKTLSNGLCSQSAPSRCSYARYTALSSRTANPLAVTRVFPTDSSKGSLEYLLQVGLSSCAIEKAMLKFPGLQLVDVDKRLQPNIILLRSIGLSTEDIQSIVVRCPAVVSLDVDVKVMPVLDFLEELGLDRPSICSVIKRFPPVLTYGVKSHLWPHIAYLKSLGVDGSMLPSLVTERPAILGSGIEQLVNHLLRSGFQRKQVRSVLRTYPFVYKIPVFPITTTPADLD